MGDHQGRPPAPLTRPSKDYIMERYQMNNNNNNSLVTRRQFRFCGSGRSVRRTRYPIVGDNAGVCADACHYIQLLLLFVPSI
jgi:hypothetical protein